MNIDKRNQEKSKKYAPFVTDITGYVCTVNCFEVSSTNFICKKKQIHTQHTPLIHQKGHEKIYLPK